MLLHKEVKQFDRYQMMRHEMDNFFFTYSFSKHWYVLHGGNDLSSVTV